MPGHSQHGFCRGRVHFLFRRTHPHLSERLVGGEILRRCVKNHTKHNQEAASMAGNCNNQQATDRLCIRAALEKNPME